MSELLSVSESLKPLTNPVSYLRGLGFEPFEWQVDALNPSLDRVLLLCARQSGKSTVVGGKVAHKIRYRRRSENLIVTPSKDQSKIVMQRFQEFTDQDDELPESDTDSIFEQAWKKRKNRVLALPGSERSVRGYADPETIIADEAAQIEDRTYIAFRPWMTGGKSELIAMSTPFGKRGWFWRAWEHSSRWHKILVRVRWDVRNGKLIDTMPEDEFKAYWKEKGVNAYYSPRHTKSWCEEELEEIGEWAFRQEYCCEFMDTDAAWFSYDEILDAFQNLEPLEREEDLYGEVEAMQL